MISLAALQKALTGITTRSPENLKKWMETYPRRDMPAELAKRFGVSEADISELIEELEEWLTSLA